jgi:protein-disulfide isomerase
MTDEPRPDDAQSQPDAAAPDGTSPTAPLESPAALPARGRAGRAAGFVAVALLGVIVGAGAMALAAGTLAGPTPTPSPSPSETPSPSADAGNVVGRPDAPVTIEVWADYQCPYCRLEALLFGGTLDREYIRPGIARVVYRDFAFLGQESIDAAVAARCAGAQDPAARMRYHDTLFTFQQGENQGRFSRANLIQMATIAGVPDEAAFSACLDSAAQAAAVAAETKAGRDLGVNSTPTMRLSGPGGERVLTGFSQAWPTLRDAIEAVRVAPVGSPSPTGSSSPAPIASTASPAPTSEPSPVTTPAP